MPVGELLDVFKKRFGDAEGARIYMTIMPGVLAGFKKMLDHKPGKVLQEEYFLEHTKGKLCLQGQKTGREYIIDAELDMGTFPRPR